MNKIELPIGDFTKELPKDIPEGTLRHPSMGVPYHMQHLFNDVPIEIWREGRWIPITKDMIKVKK